MSLRVVQLISMAGTAPTLTAAAAGGDTSQTGAGFVAIIKNSDASGKTVTIAVPGNLPTGDPYPDKVYPLAATTGEIWVPLPDFYQDPADGLAHITYSAVTGVTLAIVRMM